MSFLSFTTTIIMKLPALLLTSAEFTNPVLSSRPLYPPIFHHAHLSCKCP